MKTKEELRRQYDQLHAGFNERTRREWVASEAMSIGHGGAKLLSEVTGMAPSTIGKGIRELRSYEESNSLDAPRRIRAKGGGRKSAIEKSPTLLADLERLIAPVTRGDPESPLRWTIKSLRVLAQELCADGHQVGRNVVRGLLKQLGYSLQGNQKTREGSSQHPDRNEQFEHINARVEQHLDEGNPVISVDTKKKELVGDFKNVGREYRPKGLPEKVRVHDFLDKELGKVNPYGVYDMGANEGWVNLGINADTGEFAVESIRRWWYADGCQSYPKADELLITADGGGSNGYRLRLWKYELQKFANELGIPISVCHLPPGTSKWNKIEHRLFSFITMNWRGKPLISVEAIIKLISSTKTEQGLVVHCELDENEYEKGRKISDQEMAALQIVKNTFHGEWNYTILPTKPKRRVAVRAKMDRLVS